MMSEYKDSLKNFLSSLGAHWSDKLNVYYIKQRIAESLIKMSCLLHKQEKGMAHVTSEVQVAVVAKCGHQ